MHTTPRTVPEPPPDGGQIAPLFCAWHILQGAIVGILMFFMLTAAANACTRGWDEVPGAEPATWSDHETYERSVQGLIWPLIRGIGYDVPGQRIFISACAQREYACDLLVASVHPVGTQRAEYFRNSRQYGYLYPTIAPDGSRLAAVRAFRNARPSQRNVRHEIVEIDLRTNEERVLASAESGRFDQVIYVSNQVLLAVRSFRSAPSVRCQGDFCTDRAEIVAYEGTRRLQGAVLGLAAGAIGRGLVDIAPIGSDTPVWLIDTSDNATGGLNSTATVTTYVWERTGFSEIGSRRQQLRDFLDHVESEHGSLGGWRSNDLIASGGEPRHTTPFCATRAAQAWGQTVLADAGHGAFVMKRVADDNRVHAVNLEIVTLENRGQIPWTAVSSTIVSLPGSITH